MHAASTTAVVKISSSTGAFCFTMHVASTILALRHADSLVIAPYLSRVLCRERGAVSYIRLLYDIGVAYKELRH